MFRHFKILLIFVTIQFQFIHTFLTHLQIFKNMHVYIFMFTCVLIDCDIISSSFDACTMLQDLHTWSDSGTNLTSQINTMFHNAGASIDCPIGAQHITVSDFVFSVPQLSAGASVFANVSISFVIFLFLTHLVIGYVRFCHHLASVVSKHFIIIFLSTTGPNWIKLSWNSPLVTPV